MVRKSASTKKTTPKAKTGMFVDIKPGIGITIGVEKIESGYLVTERRYNHKTCEGTDKKSFSKTRPVIKIIYSS